jgi:chromosome segregation ATPase
VAHGWREASLEELRDARSSIQQVQTRCREAEKEKERGALERANLQADLEDARANFQDLQREYKSKHDLAEKQRQGLESLADKVEKQKEFFQVECALNILLPCELPKVIMTNSFDFQKLCIPK